MYFSCLVCIHTASVYNHIISAFLIMKFCLVFVIGVYNAINISNCSNDENVR